MVVVVEVSWFWRGEGDWEFVGFEIWEENGNVVIGFFFYKLLQGVFLVKIVLLGSGIVCVGVIRTMKHKHFLD
jgi:hypothetical protein